jgi:hypothetical protein
MTKRVNGKNKGNTFERKIANVLSDRFSNYLGIPKGFKRNGDSGSFFGGKNMNRINEYDTDNSFFGDIICPKSFLFTVECKHYKTPPTFISIISSEVKQWDEWLWQATQDAINANKKPLLIIKYNNVPEFVFVDSQIKMPEILVYKQYYCYRLADILSLADEYFFESKIIS